MEFTIKEWGPERPTPEMEKSPQISGFFGLFRFYSNFWPAPIMYKGKEWQSVEHAFAAMRTLE